MKVLIIDDHEGFREEIQDILTRNGCEAVGVDSAEAAVPLAESGDYDFVLVDFEMPEHNGLWFMKKVKLPSKTKALLVTSHTNCELISAMMAAGASGYVTKPFDEEDIMRHLTFHTRA